MRVMLGISGGVDSSVAALLLQQAGHQVEGLFMQNWEEDERNGPCSADADRKDAVAVCGRLGIPFHESTSLTLHPSAISCVSFRCLITVSTPDPGE